MFNIRKEENYSVVKISPSLHQKDYLGMKAFFRSELFPKGDINIVLDCEGVDELPSIAFGAFCSIARDAGRVGGKCALINVSDGIIKVMTMIHVDKLLATYGSLDEALTAFTE